MARHLLIATATSKYEHLRPEDERPQLTQVLASVVDLFTSKLKRYERELNAVGENPPSSVLRSDLDRWFAAPERDPTDWVVVYYTGHAEVVGSDSLYLLTSDFQPGQFVATAFSLQQFADLVLAPREDDKPRRVQNLLLIVDTCFAAKGTIELTARLSAAFRKTSGSSFYLLGAALPRQEAQAGALAKALIEAVEDLSGRYVMQEWLYFDQVLPAINRLLEVRGVQRAVLSALEAASEEPKFFPNPSFVPTSAQAVPANEAARAISDQEFRDHWGPRSRGVEFDSDVGSYFSGRKAVLDKLDTFLQGQTGSAIGIVTGRPGAGKSAILSQIVSRSLAHAKESVDTTGVASIDLAIHARGKGVADVTARLASVLDVEPKTEAVLSTLRRRSKPLRIVVDALDESTQPAALTAQLLRPLNAIDSVKLLVGTRSSELASFEGAEVIDIDDRKYADKRDLADYVKARLLRADEPQGSTPYAGKQQVAERVAAIVAEKAYPNFLVARLAVEDLLSRSAPASPASIEGMTFPVKVSAAFDAYLARFGDKERIVRDLFLPLAYAQGQGLPWDNIWAPLASALSRREYSDEDLRWLIANAGAFILESNDGGRSVYRLYHQALSDTLRSGTRAASVHRTMAKVLTASVPRRADSNAPDWLLANRYVRSHLAAHAGASGSLPLLLNDPLYLLAADANRLLPAIWQHWADVPRDIVGVYVDSLQNIREDTPAIAACHLELNARKRNLTEFAGSVVELPLTRPCSVSWANWVPQTASHSFGKGESEITCLTVANWEGSRTVALVGRKNGAVEVWDVQSGERLVDWRPEGREFVRHLALANTSRGPIVIAAWLEGRFGAFDSNVERGVVKSENAGKEPDEVSALCAIERNGEKVCVTAHRSMRLAMRSLPALEPILEKLDVGHIFGLYPVPENSGKTILSVGDYLRSKPHDSDKPDFQMLERQPSILRFLSGDDLSVEWEDLRNRNEYLTDVEEGELLGRRAILAFCADSQLTEIWDFETRALILADSQLTSRSWLYEFDGEPVLVGVAQQNLTVRRLSRAADDPHKFVATDLGAPVKIQGERFSRMFRLQGRASILSATNDRVRVWDFEDLLVAATRAGGVGRKSASDEASAPRTLAIAASSGNEVYVASHAKVLAIDGATGGLLWERDPGGRESVLQLQLASDERWLVAGTRDGTIRVLDRGAQGAPLLTIQAGKRLRRIECFRCRGLDLAFATVSSQSVWAARLWNLRTGEELPTNQAFRLHWGEEDKPMTGLAVGVAEEAVLLAFASRYGKVMVGEYSGAAISDQTYPRPYQEWRFPNASNEYIESLTTGMEAGETLLAGGSEEGHLALWNLNDGVLKASRVKAHVGAINALRFANFFGQKVLISGGVDSTLRFWTLEFTELLRLDFGEAVNAIAPLGDNRLAVGGFGGLVVFRFPKSDSG